MPKTKIIFQITSLHYLVRILYNAYKIAALEKRLPICLYVVMLYIKCASDIMNLMYYLDLENDEFRLVVIQFDDRGQNIACNKVMKFDGTSWPIMLEMPWAVNLQSFFLMHLRMLNLGYGNGYTGFPSACNS